MTSRWLLLCAMLFAAVADAQAPIDAHAAAQAGDQAYESADYAAAIEHYRAALAGGLDHADLHYNLGNALYKHGELGQAIASYERALLRSPRHESARSNLVQARQFLRDEALEPLGLPLFLKPLGWVYGRVALNEWALLALCGALLAALSAVLGQWWAPWARRARGVAFAGAFVCLLGLSLATLRTIRDHGRTRAVVTVEEADVRSGPGAGYNVSFRIHEGLLVFVSERREEWAQIHLGGQLIGWVPLAEIELL